jgi:hypothetical protein
MAGLSEDSERESFLFEPSLQLVFQWHRNLAR